MHVNGLYGVGGSLPSFVAIFYPFRHISQVPIFWPDGRGYSDPVPFVSCFHRHGPRPMGTCPAADGRTNRGRCPHAHRPWAIVAGQLSVWGKPLEYIATQCEDKGIGVFDIVLYA